MKTLIALLSTFIVAATLVAAPAYADDGAYSERELHQLLAPVALHPDSLLSNILIASTFPIEVVQAARWSRDNPGVEGEAALVAVEDRDWDPSVKALVAFPELLARMDADLDWTQKLGEAFMFQETMVMDAIQTLRDRAYAAGNLNTNEHVRVVRHESKSIAIEPARRNVVYVPYYDTRVVYGTWWAPAYPPVYWAYPPGYYSHVVFHWGRPVYVAPSFYYSSFYWPQRHVVIVHHHSPPQRWRHVSRHRSPHHQRGLTPPRRHAQREWADGRRESFPRGIRGFPQQARTDGAQRDTRTHGAGRGGLIQQTATRAQAPAGTGTTTRTPDRPVRAMSDTPLREANGHAPNRYEGRGVIGRTQQSEPRMQGQPQRTQPAPSNTIRPTPSARPGGAIQQMRTQMPNAAPQRATPSAPQRAAPPAAPRGGVMQQARPQAPQAAPPSAPAARPPANTPRPARSATVERQRDTSSEGGRVR